MVLKRVYLGLICLLAVSGYALASEPRLRAGGYWVAENKTSGGELDFSVLQDVSSDYQLLVGPRASLLWSGGAPGARVDFNLGGEATIWALNAVGLGVGADLVLPAQDEQGPKKIRLRGELPSVTFRVKRVGDESAFAFKLGPIWDSQYHWGARVGLTLQLNGV